MAVAMLGMVWVSMGGSVMRKFGTGIAMGRLLALLALVLLSGSLLAAPPARAKGPVLVLGDSLSAEHNIPRGSGWVSLLERKLSSESPLSRGVVNASISGETSAGALTRLPALLEKHKPSVLVIELGGNDALRGLAPAQLEANLRRMVELGRASGARVLLLGIDVPPNYGPAYRERLRRTYASLAEGKDVALVPFFLEGVALEPGLMQGDGLHPTAAAQPRLLDNVWPALRPLL